MIRSKIMNVSDKNPLSTENTEKSRDTVGSKGSDVGKKDNHRPYLVIWCLLGGVEVLLAFRLLLKLVGANPASPFTKLIYDLSYLPAYPFLGLLGTSVVPDGFVYEWSTAVGMIVYFTVVYGFLSLLRIINPLSRMISNRV